MIPNSSVLGSVVVPLREPAGVDLRARLPADVSPSEVQALLQEKVQTPMRDIPRILLEELDGDEVVVRIQATPERASDGPQLATEVLAAIAPSARGDNVVA
jgi:small conductance mechanosensitive channel